MKEYIIKQEEKITIEISLEFNDLKKEQKLITNFIADNLKIKPRLAQIYVEAFVDTGQEGGIKENGYIVSIFNNILYLGHYKMESCIREKQTLSQHQEDK